MVERNGKIAFITGAASGIGKATTELFSQNSVYQRIYAADINPVIYNLFDSKLYPQITPIEFDVRSFRQIDEALQRIIFEAGTIDVEVNCAGTIAAGKTRLRDNNLDDVDGRTYLSMIQANDYSVRHIIDKTAEIMKKGKDGTIIVITSSKDHFPDPYRREYEHSKSSIEEYALGEAKKHTKNGVRIVVVKPGNTKTNIDRGSWISPDSQKEMATVQNFNDLWRRIFGNDPENVAKTISDIAEGKIKNSKVFVGADAKLGRFLAIAIPGWKNIFYLGSSSLYKAATTLGQLRTNQINSQHAAPVNLSGEWLEEGVRREAEAKVSECQQVIRIGDSLYVRTIDSHKIDGNLQGVQVDYGKMQELGVKQEDLESYLDLKSAELGNTTMLLDSCEQGANGDWEYKYKADKLSDNSAFGIITVTFKGHVIFNHFITVSKVNLNLDSKLK
ncbi:MAG: SDR family NAD(P)-dependent oxidoreductase [Candidatus Levybacteria bacterium]|nr:SDR family NAD(P)-dependent oxidoreductase [Candidatus Levybacteria bacterium]